MTRTLILFLLVLILGGGTYWFLSNKEDEKTTLAGWDRDFAVENVDDIYKIFLADRFNERVTLERKSGHWIYNENYKANPNVVENLLDAIRRVEMKYKPPKNAVKPMIESLATEGIKVEIYDKKGELIKAYYVGGATADERGTYMIRDGAEEPYVVHIPSWEGNIRFRYNIRGANWMDKTVIQEDIEDIQSVSMEYPKQRNRSFRLERDGSDYKVEPFHETTQRINRPLKKGSVEQYLINFEKPMIAEGFEHKNPKRDSVVQTVPFSILTLMRKDSSEMILRFFPIPIKGELDPKSNTYINSGSIDRFYAEVTTDNSFYLVQNRIFQKVFWAYEFFYE